MKNYVVMLFHTTSDAIRTEKLLKTKGFVVKLIPTPRQFSSDCGVALRFEAEEADSILRQVLAAGIGYSSTRPLT